MSQRSLELKEADVRQLLRLSRRLNGTQSVLHRRRELLTALCRATGAVSGFGMLLDDAFQPTGDVTIVKLKTAAIPVQASEVMSKVSTESEENPVWLEPVGLDSISHAPSAIPSSLEGSPESVLARDEARELFNLNNPMAEPFLRTFAGRFLEPTALARRQTVPDSSWYKSDYFEQFRRQAGLDDCLLSAVPLPGCQPFFAAVCLSRPMTETATPINPQLTRFSERDRRMAELIHAELRWAYYTKPVSAIETDAGEEDTAKDVKIQVAPRLQRVLFRLLAGDSEKEAATHLGLSKHTIHEYVRALYRELGVRSRAEFMSKWIVPTPNRV